VEAFSVVALPSAPWQVCPGVRVEVFLVSSPRRLLERGVMNNSAAHRRSPLPARRYPNAGREWGWHWVFSASSHYLDRTTGIRHRCHLQLGGKLLDLGKSR
jgi:hypothetical protein